MYLTVPEITETGFPWMKLKCSRTRPYMSLVVRKSVFGVVTRSHTNQSLQPHKMARGLKFRIKEVEGSYYLCSENKGAEQLCGHREADLRLCFRICKKSVFSRCGSYNHWS